MAELHAIAYQDYVTVVRARHQAQRAVLLDAMTPQERLATEFREDVIFYMSPGTDITCGSNRNPTYKELVNWHRLDVFGLTESKAVQICASTARSLLQEGWFTWNHEHYVYLRTQKVLEPWE